MVCYTAQSLMPLEVSVLQPLVLPFEKSVLQQPIVYGLKFFSVMKLAKEKLPLKIIRLVCARRVSGLLSAY
jgi:hypothetical protein